MIKLKSGVILSEIEEDSQENSDTAIIVDTNSGKYISLNRTALSMISVAINVETEDEAITSLLELYEIDSQTLEDDLHNLIDRLHELHLID